MLVVGEVTLSDLLPSLRRLESQLGREINVRRYSAREFNQKVRAGDHLLHEVLQGKLVTIAGSADDLEEVDR